MPKLRQAIFGEIADRRPELSEAITARIYGMQPEEWARYGRKGRELSVRDVGYHLMYLTEALTAGDPGLFVAYLDWANVLFTNLRLPRDALTVTLQHMRAVLREQLPPETADAASQVIDAGLRQLPVASTTVATFIPDDAPMAELAREYLDTVLAGDRWRASRLILDAVESGVDIRDVYLRVFQPAQMEVGRLWQMNRVSVAHEHFCTAATQMIISQLYPRIFSSRRVGRSLVATCISGELHEIGARMVSDFLELEGWDTYYLGANTPTEGIVQMVKERNAHVVAVSATMTYHISAVANLVDAVRSAVGENVKVMVGGYPFRLSDSLWQSVGADGCAEDAQGAVALANELVGG